jgi:hypothetical protein
VDGFVTEICIAEIVLGFMDVIVVVLLFYYVATDIVRLRKLWL